MTNSLKYMVDNLVKENMALRRDGTRLKLVILQIIEDLQEDEKYVRWIRENCNTELYSRMDIEELNYVNRKRTVDFVRAQQLLKEQINHAHHSIEIETILRIAILLELEWW